MRFVIDSEALKEDKIVRDGVEKVFRKQECRFDSEEGDSFRFELTIFEGQEPYKKGTYTLDPRSFDRVGGRLVIPRVRLSPVVGKVA